MRYSFVYTSPVVPFLSLEEAKEDLLVQHALDDRRINRLIAGASEYIERRTGMTFANRSVRLAWEAYPPQGCVLEVYHGRVSVVTAFGPGTSAGVTDPLDPVTGYGVWGEHHPALIVPPAGGWPVQPAGKLIVFEGALGLGPGRDAVPDDIKNACHLIVSHRYYKRGDAARLTADDDIPPAAKDILDLYWSGRYV